MSETNFPRVKYTHPSVKLSIEEADGNTTYMVEQIHHLTCRIVEKQEDVIMGTIHRIAGEEFKEFTIDKHKVVDAFRRATPVRFTPAVDNGIIMAGFCPTCNGSVEIEKTASRMMKGACCSWCGQKLDVKNLFRD